MGKPNVKLVNQPQEFKSKGRFHGPLTLTSGSAQTLADLGVSIERMTDYVLISGEGGTWRWRDDGTAPTTTVGHEEWAGEQVVWHRAFLESVSMIAVSDNVTLFMSELGL